MHFLKQPNLMCSVGTILYCILEICQGVNLMCSHHRRKVRKVPVRGMGSLTGRGNHVPVWTLVQHHVMHLEHIQLSSANDTSVKLENNAEDQLPAAPV